MSARAPRDFFAEQGLEPLDAQGYRREARVEAFPYLKALSERVLVFDGAMGTEIFKHNLTEADYGGEAYSGCPEILNRTRPDVIAAIHRSYLEAGADVIETNTFGCLPHVLSEYNLEAEAEDLALEAARLARQVADQRSRPQKPPLRGRGAGPRRRLISLGRIGWAGCSPPAAPPRGASCAVGWTCVLLETPVRTSCRCAARCWRYAGPCGNAGTHCRCRQVTVESTGTMLVGASDAAAPHRVGKPPCRDVVGMKTCAVGPLT